MGLNDPAQIQLVRCQPVKVSSLGGRWNCNLHSPYWRCYFHDHDGARLHGDNDVIPLDADRLYLIPPRSRFFTSQAGDQHQLFVHFTTRGPLERAVPGCYPCDRDRGLRRRAAALLRCLIDRQPSTVADQLEAEALVLGCLVQLPSEAWDGSAGGDARVTAAIDQVLDDLAQPIDVAALAYEQGLGRTPFIRLFKRETGEPPLRYLNGLKIDLARRWLEDGERSIDQIASATGFVDRSHFSRVFKQRVGQTPAAYRDSWRA